MAGNKHWSIEDVDYLKNNWHNNSIEALMLKLNRTKDSVFRKAIRIGLNTRKKEEDLLRIRWDKKSDNYIIKNYKKQTSAQIGKILNRSATVVRKRAAYLGITGTVKKWTEEEEEYLYENWGVRNINTIAKKLNRSRNAVLLKAHYLGLREQIIANGAYLTPPDIEEILGIPIRTIYNWIWIGKLTCKKFNVGKRKKYQINPSEFCKFLELNQGSWNTQNADITLPKESAGTPPLLNKVKVGDELRILMLNKPYFSSFLATFFV